ncbi:unnamed protein product [Adineta steineri]|uniref:TIR domain-containing protein n=1 Tax=Adineta steineri TaxID=433720 RepID=A0A814FTS4_9BILA|nr:unnamed protein product [Adineta steineri]CAF0988227.1 unnamed protein product [Adineta steineri]CAF1331511.1 unnamed protein product [Adineta steineri]CAF1589565.1 unnamed protein product [Adineta steineri]
MGGCQARSTVDPRSYERHPRVIAPRLSSDSGTESDDSIVSNSGLVQILDEMVTDINNNTLKLCDFRTRLSEKNIKADKFIEPILIDHEFILLLARTIKTILEKWDSPETQSLSESDKLIFRNAAIFLAEIAENFNVTTSPRLFRSFLCTMMFLDVMQQCLEDMVSNGKHLMNNDDNYNLESFIYLLNIFQNFKTPSSQSADEVKSVFKLLTLVSDIIRSKYYFETFFQLSHDASEFNTVQQFILDKCPVFLNAYTGIHSFEIHDTLLEQIFDQCVQILEHFIPNIETWKIPVIRAITHIVDIMVNASSTTQAHIFQQPKIIDYALTILRNQKLCARLQSKTMNPEIWLINSTLTGLHNMIYDAKLLAILRKKTLTSVFIQITNTAKYDRIRIHAYLILAGILSEVEIKELNNAKEITMIFFKYLNKAMESNQKMYKGVTLMAMLCGLKTLVQHDEIKNTILAQDPNLQLLSNIIFKTNNQELAHGLSILWTLSFNKEVAATILNKSELMNKIRNLAEITKHDIDKDISAENIKLTNVISSAAQGILWQVYDRTTDVADNKPQKNTEENMITDKSMDLQHSDIHSPVALTKKKYDVMISYSHDDKQLCHKIADQLLNDGFTVWIDRNNMTGLTPAAIADGIENSEIIILGMTYSYKISPWCQREGNYAFQRQTKIIPLKLPPAYHADGWLGLLLANLNYVNFTKHQFDIAYEQLKTEIENYRKQVINSPHRKLFLEEHETPLNTNVTHEANTIRKLDHNEHHSPVLSRSDALYTSIPIQNWTQQNVMDFLNDKKLHQFILLCNDMDGPALQQLYAFCNNNSTTAFESLHKQLKKKSIDDDLSPIEYTRFISEMKKLSIDVPPPPPVRSGACTIS